MLIAGVSQVSHFNAELGFDKAQSEQIHIPGLLEGAFIPAAAKSKPLNTGTPDSTIFFASVASRTGGVGLLFAPKMPNNCEVLLLPPTTLGGLTPEPKVNGFGFELEGSNPKENGVDDLEGTDSGLLEGVFLPPAAKSNPLNTGTSDSTFFFASVASRMGGVGVLFIPKTPGELLLPPTTLSGITLGPKVNGFGFELEGSNPKENDVDDLEGPDSGLLEGVFIPPAAKPNPLNTEPSDSTSFFISVASKTGGVGVLFTPKMPGDCGLLFLPTLGGLLPAPKGNNFGFGFAGSNPKENGVDDLEGPDPELLGGVFIPPAAKSNALTTGTPDSTFFFISAASRTGGVGVLFTPKILGLLLLPTTLNGLPPEPKGNGFGFGLAGSNPKENGVDDLDDVDELNGVVELDDVDDLNGVDDVEVPDESSKFGSDETGRSLTRLCTLATTELGKIEVALDVMTKVGRELGVIARAFALMSSTMVSLSLTFTFFACSCGFGDPVGETSFALNEKLKLEEGGSNLKSDFGRPGEGAGNTAGLNVGVDGAEVPSGWKLNLNLLGSLGTELNLLRDAVGLMLVGLVEVGDDPFSMIGMINFDCSLFSAASMSISSNMSILISDSEATVGVLSKAVGIGLCPLIETLVRFADR